MADATVASALPTIVVPGGGDDYRGRGGFCPSDAALVRAGQSQDAHLINLVAAKDAQRESVETRHQIERSIKEAELTTERAMNRMQMELAAVKSELQSKIEVENAVTRAQIQGYAGQALNASTVELLMRRLLVIRPGTGGPAGE